MDKLQRLQDLLVTQASNVPLVGFVFNLLLAAALSFVLSRIYIRYGASLSNRRLLARNFMLLTMTTMLVITVVKSSLALSLGLVGALSIVRFRAAIKEPEELLYLFLAIGIGLGLGADQRVITIIALAVISLAIYVRHFENKSLENQNLYLTVSSHNPRKADLQEIVDILKKHCSGVNLKRFDETEECLEASFLVEYNKFDELEASRKDLNKLGDSMRITFLDNKGIN